MKIHTLKYIGLFCMLCLVACQSQDTDETLSQASLTVTFKTSDTETSSRAVVSEDLNGDGTVTELDDIVDGRRMYSLAVVLLDEDNVQVREGAFYLEKDNPNFKNNNSEATVTFERLNYGKKYTVLAVANYGDYDTTTKGKLQSADNLNGTVNVTADNTSYLCLKTTPYPLSLKKEITLQPGANTVTGELVRTYARLRIHVRNQNQDKELKITGLDFGDKFTKASASLFKSEEVGNASVAPMETSQDAITPFANPTTIDKNTGATIFDAYLLESKGGDYTYTLGLEYEYEGMAEKVYTVDNNNPITDPAYIDDGGMYVIYNTNSQHYLYANGEKVVAGSYDISNDEVDAKYVWKLIKTGSSDNYFIESMEANSGFMQSSKVTSGEVTLVSDKGDDEYFIFVEEKAFGYKYMNLKSASNIYLNVEGNTVNSVSSPLWGHRFKLYKVTESTESSSTTKITYAAENIPISTINKETGEAIPIKAINRNDFIDILVNVNYNEKTGEFQFKVADWDEKEGEMTFD